MSAAVTAASVEAATAANRSTASHCAATANRSAVESTTDRYM